MKVPLYPHDEPILKHVVGFSEQLVKDALRALARIGRENGYLADDAAYVKEALERLTTAKRGGEFGGEVDLDPDTHIRLLKAGCRTFAGQLEAAGEKLELLIDVTPEVLAERKANLQELMGRFGGEETLFGEKVVDAGRRRANGKVDDERQLSLVDERQQVAADTPTDQRPEAKRKGSQPLEVERRMDPVYDAMERQGIPVAHAAASTDAPLIEARAAERPVIDPKEPAKRERVDVATKCDYCQSTVAAGGNGFRTSYGFFDSTTCKKYFAERGGRSKTEAPALEAPPATVITPGTTVPRKGKAVVAADAAPGGIISAEPDAPADFEAPAVSSNAMNEPEVREDVSGPYKADAEVPKLVEPGDVVSAKAQQRARNAKQAGATKPEPVQRSKTIPVPKTASAKTRNAAKHVSRERKRSRGESGGSGYLDA